MTQSGKFWIQPCMYVRSTHDIGIPLHPATSLHGITTHKTTTEYLSFQTHSLR